MSSPNISSYDGTARTIGYAALFLVIIIIIIMIILVVVYVYDTSRLQNTLDYWSIQKGVSTGTADTYNATFNSIYVSNLATGDLALTVSPPEPSVFSSETRGGMFIVDATKKTSGDINITTSATPSPNNSILKVEAGKVAQYMWLTPTSFIRVSKSP